MSKTTIPNGASNGVNPSLAEMLPSFETDARFGEEQSAKVGGDPLVLQNFLFMFYDQDNVTASLRQEIYQIDRENERHRASAKHSREEVDALRSSIQNLITERGRLAAERQNEIANKKVEIRRIKGGDYTLLGTNAQVQRAQQNDPSRANQYSVALELQADCYAGVWVGSNDVLENQAELQEALDAAEGVGDDRIQQKTQGRIDPESWTHGSAEQRRTWFLQGYNSQNPRTCDATFNEITR